MRLQILKDNCLVSRSSCKDACYGLWRTNKFKFELMYLLWKIMSGIISTSLYENIFSAGYVKIPKVLELKVFIFNFIKYFFFLRIF